MVRAIGADIEPLVSSVTSAPRSVQTFVNESGRFGGAAATGVGLDASVVDVEHARGHARDGSGGLGGGWRQDGEAPCPGPAEVSVAVECHGAQDVRGDGDQVAWVGIWVPACDVLQQRPRLLVIVVDGGVADDREGVG